MENQQQKPINVEDCYRRYGPMVLRRCRQLLGDESSAVDAMQDVFVKLIRYEDRLTGDALSSLLYRMATNVCLNKLRSERRHPKADMDEQQSLLEQIADSEDLEDKTIATHILERLFRRQPESTKVMAVLHYHDGLTLEEVAEAVGMSVSGVRKRLRGLRERLKLLQGELA
ncbi:MAG: sigma-70 family RNA polymerase sigma factor [Gammaproteobacteria bacterium]|nr:sigma-70 family RNA polymerase sigma factor [Gammaproteobacteria bacterium]MDH5727821.1 sigma-70 family RNA polymerase sigma factor [Gammaproteobacteria bacterium]